LSLRQGVTLRKRAARSEEAANAVAFLLRPRSSGVNAQRIMVDAGIAVNYFDHDLIHRAMRPEYRSRCPTPQLLLARAAIAII